MIVHGKEYNVDNLLQESLTESHVIYNGMYLSDSQISILNNNGFDYKKYKNIKELMFDIDEYLYNEPDNIELERVLEELSEYDYYHNTNK